MRVVITAAGGVSSLGSSTQELIDSFQGSFPDFKEQFSVFTAPIIDFQFKDFVGKYKNKRYLNRGAALTLAGAVKTVQNSGIELDKDCGLFVGAGPNLVFPEKGDEYSKRKALWLLEHLSNTASSSISALLDIHGENSTIGTACTASLQAIGEGYRRIKYNQMEMALAGGGDSRLSQGGVMGYKMAGALYKGSNPSKEYSPLRAEPLGFIPGEGSGFVILETLDSALKNNREILAEIVGFGQTMDGYNMTDPAPDGYWQSKAISLALKEAGIGAEEIGVIVAHGTGTPLNDEMELKLIESLFNNESMLLTFKEWFGHLSAGCGAVELWGLIACFKSGFFPLKHRSNNYSVSGNSLTNSNYALIQNFGFGGQNAVLVVKKWG